MGKDEEVGAPSTGGSWGIYSIALESCGLRGNHDAGTESTSGSCPLVMVQDFVARARWKLGSMVVCLMLVLIQWC